MKFAKTVLVLLFSLALLGTQTVFVANLQAGEETESSCCESHCSCCAAPSEPAPAPQPVAPLRAGTQNDLQLVAVVAQLLLQQTTTITPRTVSVPLLPSSVSAVPIYTRNCSFLI